MYDAATPRMIGMILSIPLPQILKIMIVATATNATTQFVLQLAIAEGARIKPIAMIIGPVTTGGKNFITRFTPNPFIKADITIYTSPAQKTPPHAYGSISLFGAPFTMGATAPYPPRNANDEPRKAGTFPFVRKWKSKVPRPAIRSVVLTLRPVKIGTSIVAPNMANVC